MIEGVEWPALLTGRAAVLAALAAELDRTQWQAETEIEALQFEQLGRLLDHAFEHVPFYRGRLAAAGYRRGVHVDRAAWERIPVLERAELQQRGVELRSAATPAAHGGVREFATSGSTGTPVRVQRTALTGLFWELATMRACEWRRWDYRGRLAAIRWYPGNAGTFPEGLSYPDWNEPFSLLYPCGPSFGLAVTATLAQQAQWVRAVEPDYLTVFPSVLAGLIDEFDRAGARPARLKEVRTISEVLDPALRARCAERWGVPVQDVYSAQEVGYLALQCPEHEHYRVQSECARVEVVDANGAACRAGETGRVVVTPLHNFAMPLVRYAIGDYAVAGAPCPCGRGLPVLDRILGRARNMLITPTGERIWPRASELRYAEVLPVTQFQVVQTAPDRLELRLVSARRGTPEEEARLAALVTAQMGYPFQVTLSYVDEIPRSAGGKFEDFRSELGT